MPNESRDRRPRGVGSDRGRPRGPITVTPRGELPRWVRDEITRSTGKEKREAALVEFSAGLGAFSDERYRQAAAAFRRAKALSPRAGTVRELLGLACYQIEEWEESLRELRAYRRLTGETEHMAVEMDCLRALRRADSIEKTWTLFSELGGSKDAEDEMRVVYGSYLLDSARIAEAWKVVKPGRLIANPGESSLRRWAVAARVAAASGDREAAHRLLDAIRREDPDLEWLDELEAAID